MARVLQSNCVVGLANHPTLPAANGREIPIEDSASPTRDAGGQVAGAVAKRGRVGV